LNCFSISWDKLIHIFWATKSIKILIFIILRVKFRVIKSQSNRHVKINMRYLTIVCYIYCKVWISNSLITNKYIPNQKYWQQKMRDALNPHFKCMQPAQHKCQDSCLIHFWLFWCNFKNLWLRMLITAYCWPENHDMVYCL
jgi:hypothetical protein